MDETRVLPRLTNGRWRFFQQFLRNPMQLGSVTPSSRFLERRIIEAAGFDDAALVVELGPGNGGTTRAFLKALGPQARLLSIELNRAFYEWVTAISDPRFTAHLGDARDLSQILERYNLPAPDVVISGIPFSTMPSEHGSRILEAVHGALAPGGRFVAYQFSGRVAELAQPIMGATAGRLEARNLPPMRVYRWEKKWA